MHFRSTCATILLSLAFLAGCGQGATTPAVAASSDLPGAAQSIVVAVAPPSASVSPGGTVSFSAATYGTADSSVVWQLREANGGSIDQAGHYTAPEAPGTYHVVATSAVDQSVVAVATVTVDASGASVAPSVPALPASTLNVWVPTIAGGAASGLADAMVRIGPSADQPASPVRTIAVAAARGETEPFQIIVRHSAPITNLDISATQLSGPNGATIPASAFEFYRQDYTTIASVAGNVTGGANPGRAAGTYPDGLIPYVKWDGTPFAYARTARPVAANSNQGLWVDLRVPRGAGYPPGVYTGSITVTATDDSGTRNAYLPVALTLWNFELPLAPTLETAFGDMGDLGAGYLDPADPAVQYRKQILLQNKIAPQFIGVRWSDDGTLPARLASYRSEYGLSSNGIPYYANSDGNGGIYGPGDGSSGFSAGRTASEVNARPAGMPMPHMQVGDEQYYDTRSAWSVGGNVEANYSQVRAWNRAARSAAGDGGRRMLTLINANADSHGLVYNGVNPGDVTDGAAADIYDPLLDYMFRDLNAYNTVTQLGAVHWTYTTQVQDGWSPKWTLEFDLINERVLPGFMAQALDLKGILISQIDAMYSGNQWSQTVSGDSNGIYNEAQVYSGQPIGLDGPAPTMRLFSVRKGIEDYEYVALLKAAGKYDGTTQAMVQGVGGSVPTRSLPANTGIAWGKDPAALQGARYTIGAILNALNP